MTQAANREKLIRGNRRLGIITLGLVAFGLAGSALLGEGLSASSWTTVVLLTLIGLGELFTARLVRLERDAPPATSAGSGNSRQQPSLLESVCRWWHSWRWPHSSW